MLRTKREQVVAGLDRVLELCRQLGLGAEVESSRFVVYRQIIQAHLEGRDPCAEHETDVGRRNMLFGAALAEGLELALLADFLEKGAPRVLAPKLRAILGGPAIPADEDQTSNNARNIMFELVLAEKLSRARLNPVLGEHPDLQCKVEETALLIECKRPLSEKQIRTRAWKANEQLQPQLRQQPNARGIVAISVSKAINRGDCFLRYSDEERASAHLSDELERWAVESGARTLPFPGSIVSLLFHVMTVAVNREDGTIVHASQVNVEVRAPDGTSEYRAVRRLYEALRSIADDVDG